MTLLIMTFAAVITSIVWYNKNMEKSSYLGTLCLMYWGAALMWLVDAVFEYVELGANYFAPDPLDMLNDSFLGLAAVALGLVIWFAILCIKDPKDIVKNALARK